MIEFYPGEEKLVSMSTQLEKQGLYDKRFKYSAGGVLRFTKDLHTFELLLLETSSAYNAAAKEKASFDHYKGMYGLLAILKTIADTYPYADLSVFKKLKVHFLHVHGERNIRWNRLYIYVYMSITVCVLVD